MHAEQIDRMVSRGISPSFLIGYIGWWGITFRDRQLGASRTDHYDPCASALRAVTIDAAWQCLAAR